MVCIFSGTFHGFLSDAVTVPGDTVTSMDGFVLSMLVGYAHILDEQAFKT